MHLALAALNLGHPDSLKVVFDLVKVVTDLMGLAVAHKHKLAVLRLYIQELTDNNDLGLVKVSIAVTVIRDRLTRALRPAAFVFIYSYRMQHERIARVALILLLCCRIKPYPIKRVRNLLDHDVLIE